MTILIANIGTSDLAVKLTGFDYYVPIGFDRDQPNLPREGLTDDEAALWDQRGDLVAELLCDELGVEVKKNQKTNRLDFSFRDLTEKLFEAYENNPETWEPRLCPGRIAGVLQSAIEKHQVEKAWIFVTDQEERHPQDSVNLFKIVKLWVERKQWKLKLKPHVIDKKKGPHKEDEMVAEYYNFFCDNQEIKQGELILVSIKGGTTPMQTAMKLQTISTGVQHLFLDPQLSVKQILAGEFSDCKPSSYWRYRRSQKYQVVERLLKRWDFDGAREVLKDWKNTLDFLKTQGLEKTEESKFTENQDEEKETEESKLAENQEVVGRAIGALDMAVCYLNFDEAGAKKAFDNLRKQTELEQQLTELKQLVDGYDKLLNLYTTCRIFWDLEQIANLLPRLGSFYEETLHEIFRGFNEKKYFDRVNHPEDWYLKKNIVRGEPTLRKIFYKKENDTNEKFGSKWVSNNGNQQDNLPDTYKLPGRFSKRNFAEALIESQKDSLLLRNGEKLFESLKNLDYWVEKRNQLIHGGKGVSKETMQKLWDADYNSKKKKVSDDAPAPCQPHEIIAEMTIISCQIYELFPKSSSGLLKFVGQDTPHYIYDEIAKWAIDRLMTDGLE